MRLRLINRGHRTINLRIVGIAEWILGANRADRGTTITSAASQRAAPDEGNGGTAVEPAGEERRMTTLFCSQRDRAGGFGGGTAFFGLAGDTEDLTDWTCDRRESFDARGRLVIPDQYGQASGGGLDPCAAIATRITLRAGDTIERSFLLGWAASPEGAQALAASTALVAPLQRRQAVR